MTMPPSQPPGWYHAQGDPPGTNRWWDGAQWVGGPVAAASGPAPQYAPQYAPPSAHYWAPPEPYTGWWTRFAANLVDRLVIGVPAWIIIRATVSAVPKRITTCRTSDGRLGLCSVPTDQGWAVIALVAGVCLVGAAVYFSVLTARNGQTLGKRALGIAVVDRTTHQPIGLGRSVGRFFGMFVSSLLCGLGFLWAAWDGEKQTWHDKMVSSIVVPARR